MSKDKDAIDAAIAVASERLAERDRGVRNRAAWPVAMHLEGGELKEDRPLGRR